MAGTVHLLSGVTNWTGGTFSGSLTVAAGAALNISGKGSQTLAADSTLSNAGTVVQSGGASLTLQGFQYNGYHPSTVNNLAGATWDLAGDGGVQWANSSYGTPSAAFNNAGTFQKTAGSGTSLVSASVTLTNSGTVAVDTGTLAVPGGFTNSGTFTGPGTLALGGTITGNGVLAGQGNLLTDGSTVSGAFTVTGAMNWAGGTLNGALTVAPGATLDITGSGAIAADSTLTNSGTVVQSGTALLTTQGYVYFGNHPSTINNLAGATWSLAGDGGVQWGNPSYGSSSATFNNAGTFQKTAGSGTSLVGAGVPFNNSGTVEADSGTLAVQSQLTQSAGAIILKGGNLSASPSLSGGVFSGAGVVTGNISSNGGTIDPGQPVGVVTINGDYGQGLLGRLNVGLNGTTPATQYDQLAVNGTVTLDGSLNVSLGYTPAPGDSFTIIDNDGTEPVAGTFAGLPQNAVLTAGGYQFRIDYAGGTGNDVVLTVVGPATPAVAATAVGDGTNNRSKVTSLTVQFSQPVALGPGALILSQLTTDSSGNVLTTADVSPGVAWSSPDGGTTWVASVVAGGPIDGGNGSLSDGVYRLTLHAAAVTAVAGGTPMAGGDQVLSTFHRLFGDTDGNGTVNALDYAHFKQAFGSSSGAPGYNAALDFDGNGTVNALDYAQFKKRFGMTFVYQ